MRTLQRESVILIASSLVLQGPGGRANGQCQPGWTGEFGTSGLNSPPNALIWFDDGSGPALFAGGFFTSAGGVAVNGMARWDGVQWEAIGAGLPGFALRLAVLDLGTGPALYAATVASQPGAFRLARWDGQGWIQAGPQSPTTGLFWEDVTRPVAFDDGSTGPRVYLGTTFWSPNGVGNSGQVIRLDEPVWTVITPNNYTSFSDLAVFDDGSGERLYAGGFRRNPQLGNEGFLGRWDGAKWETVATSPPSTARCTVLQPSVHNGKPVLFAGGIFSQVGGVPVSNVAVFDGTAWAALGAGVSAGVWALTMHDDGSGPALYAGGEFSQAGGQAVNGIARWDGSAWSPVGGGVTAASGAPGWVGSMASAGPVNGLYAGGSFHMAGTTPSDYVARWACGCYPDCNADGALTVADFGCFQSRFVAAHAYADCTADGVLTVADFGCFQARFVAGCP